MGRFDNIFALELLEIQITIHLVALYALFYTASKSFCAAQPLGLAECAISKI